MLRALAPILLAIPALHAQTLEVTPAKVLFDEIATIRATGLQPNERVTIKAELTDAAKMHWTSHAEFVADATGAVDTSKQASVAGTYKETSPMGLVWSMLPDDKSAGRYAGPAVTRNQPIDFELQRRGAAPLKAQLEQAGLAPDVRQVRLLDNIRGAIYYPPGEGKHPAVLVLGGSEGGLQGRRAAWLANHGYVALALAYFHWGTLPPLLQAIPLEYFGQALYWMSQQPEIDPDHIAVMGVSRGGELSLQLGSMFPMIKAVVAYVPSNVRRGACCGDTRVPYAWTWRGQPLEFSIRPGPKDLAAQIEVERTRGPILMISGESDGIWESSPMADAVVNRLKNHKFSFEVQHLKYPHAGHTAGRPDIEPAWEGVSKQPISERVVSPGGTPKGNAESSLDAIPKVLDFLNRSLNGH